MSRAIAIHVNKTESEILRDRIEFIELVLRDGNPRFKYDFYSHARGYYNMVADYATLVRSKKVSNAAASGINEKVA